MNKCIDRKDREEDLRPSTQRRPLRMLSLRPVPRTMTSYSTSMAADYDED